MVDLWKRNSLAKSNNMPDCKNCAKPIEVKQGRRPREFCDNNQKCRNEYFRKNKKAATHKTIPIEQWNEIEKKLAEDKSGFNGIVPAVEATGKKVPYSNTEFTAPIKKLTEMLINENNKERIAQLEKELKNVPAKLKIPKHLYISIREQELAKLKSQTT